mmetsp:Transcript_13414/g.18338  ORF Transcript_13414/g.18338 Transcript_13414/m.18338 type:complete len:251 (+) Transcript_13414:237-989(+)|eukprot:CAMPEP_0196583116 /NCGR_PEP_ID=MMETSP1081-20130531/42046_1 /TAXON_ID=36882 /ORGANISM="Pyramimonas amylifera, Strain CCMP720" /LENGTH=250 /DNA_ID=CAMNT_0041903887 /DNA_START=230 /DNA_END=982 /DNA_ORIENTATION=+
MSIVAEISSLVSNDERRNKDVLSLLVGEVSVNSLPCKRNEIENFNPDGSFAQQENKREFSLPVKLQQMRRELKEVSSQLETEKLKVLNLEILLEQKEGLKSQSAHDCNRLQTDFAEFKAKFELENSDREVKSYEKDFVSSEMARELVKLRATCLFQQKELKQAIKDLSSESNKVERLEKWRKEEMLMKAQFREEMKSLKEELTQVKATRKREQVEWEVKSADWKLEKSVMGEELATVDYLVEKLIDVKQT